MNIEEARKKMHMSRKEVSDWLEIPYRTMCGWENGERVCPTYVEKLIVEKILRGKEEKENANMKTLGTWWNDKNIEIVEIEGRPIALYGWNGETYLNCWEVKEMINGTGFDIKEDGLRVRPLYKQIDEDEFKVVGYELL